MRDMFFFLFFLLSIKIINQKQKKTRFLRRICVLWLFAVLPLTKNIYLELLFYYIDFSKRHDSM
jgi:hypothetical protein